MPETPRLDRLLGLAAVRGYERVEHGRVEHVGGYTHAEAEVQRLADVAMNSPRGRDMGGDRRLFEAEARAAVHSVIPGTRDRFHEFYGISREPERREIDVGKALPGLGRGLFKVLTGADIVPHGMQPPSGVRSAIAARRAARRSPKPGKPLKRLV